MLTPLLNRCRFGLFHVINNDYINWQLYAIGGSASPTILSHGNRFLADKEKEVFSTIFRSNSFISMFFCKAAVTCEIDLYLFLVESQTLNCKISPGDEARGSTRE